MVLTYIRPDADDTDGGWTDEGGATTLFDHIDESSATDSDYIQSGNSPDHDIVKLRLSDPSVALLQRPTTVRYRYRKKGDPNTPMNLTATLLQGSTEIASWTHTDIDGTFTTAEQVLTEAQFNSISDFTDLFIQFDAYSDWWLVDSAIDMDFEADLYHEETPDSAHFLMHADLQAGEVDGSTVFRDATGRHPITVAGATNVDTAQSKFGGASALFNGNPDRLILDNSNDFAFGTGDFTIDCWLRISATGQYHVLYDGRTATGTVAPMIYVNQSDNKLIYDVAGSGQITGTTALTTGTWYHIELGRSGTSTKLFLNGTQEGSTYSDSNNYVVSTAGPMIGARFDNAANTAGWIEELRVLNGTCAHTTTFTPPTKPYSAPITGPYTQLSCSRASPATTYAKTSSGTLTAFGANLLRITDLGLLVEDSRTNGMARSYEMSDAAWTKLNASVTADATTAPDGTTTADKIIPDATNNIHRISQGISVAGNTNVAAFCVYAKAAGYNFIKMLHATGDGAWFDLSNGTTGTTEGTITSKSIEAMGNGWYRCIITDVGMNGDAMYFYPCTADAVDTFIGDGTSGIYVWGAQYEVSCDFPSSYIPTTSASVTRSQDAVTAIGTLDIVLKGPALSTVIDLTATDIGGADFPVWLGQTGATQKYFLYSISNSYNIIRSSDNVTGLSATTGGASLTTGAKAGYADDNTGRSIVMDGGTVASDAFRVAPTTNIRLGISTTADTVINPQTTRRLTVWSSRLADATLQDYTDPGTTLAFPVDDQVRVDLDFENGQYYVSSPYEFLSCSRASTGYAKNSDGTLTLFAANQLRIGDGTGLLVEDARTNNNLYSQDFSQASWWSNTRLTATTGQSAPDGTSTATKLVPNATADTHTLDTGQCSVATTAGVRSTSIFVKSAGYHNVRYSLSDGVSIFRFDYDIDTQTVSNQVNGTWTGITISAETFVNSWLRLKVTATSANSTYVIMQLLVLDNSSNTQYSGDGTSGVISWGWQMENLVSFPSSYIPTTSSSATRAADTVTCIGAVNSTLFNVPASIVMDMTLQFNVAATNIEFLGEGLGSDAFFYHASANNTTVRSVDAGTNVMNATSGGPTFTDGVKLGYASDNSGRSLVMGAGTVVTDAFEITADAVIKINPTGTDADPMLVHRLTVWTSRIADATLQGHTQP